MEACQSGRMGLPAKELSLRGPQVQILSPPQEYLRTDSYRKAGIGAFYCNAAIVRWLPLLGGRWAEKLFCCKWNWFSCCTLPIW